ncbi:MAG: protein phosphatase 2C domain-containing protein [Eubacteriales bacterium]
MIWRGCGICHIGKIREKNEDNLLFCGKIREKLVTPVWEADFANGTEPTIFAVMDGMGGESHGEWASLVAATGLEHLGFATKEEIAKRLQVINEKICQRIRADGQRRIGSTVVVARLEGNQVDFLNIGDSRGYLWQDGTLTQLSHDHTEWQSKRDMGFTEAQLKKSRIAQSVLTQHLGIFPEEMIIEPYITQATVAVGDKLLLCSDGLSGMVSDEAMTQVFAQNLPAEATAHQLLQLALDGGGRDNVTIEVVEFGE